ncbi:Flavocytochrome c [Ascoidea rubescens DSM 1968]|uniref:Flavocytochrome c n=1 Tax=Ascoidea rubescens DSM 1968 TaxID=1344418 RepID=A0A1D2VR92_9ASCO|nr:Flavocytochrome c [Ascoidea rubescens DSM 1968]ODV64098.1 Flavocytochrome c [Ascoidea rubescens DSM 1968]
MTDYLELENVPKNPIIVVGGGLAGLSAAHQCLINGSNVVLLDKQAFFGGNSTKATSGINGSLTRTQVKLNINDSVDSFLNDTLKSAKGQADEKLAKVLTYESASAVEWLQDYFNLDLSLVSRLGGHSQPRTHRGKDARFPGMAITYALMEKIEHIFESNPERVLISKKSKVVKLIKNDSQNFIKGLIFEKDGKNYQIFGPVILATGGYAADFDDVDNSLLNKYRPDIMDLPTTNGNHATGDGQKLVIKSGGIGIDLEKVQIHPTGLVNPKDINSKFKFLAGEALRGEGAIMLDATGKRFCDELGTRDYVSNEMTKVKAPIRLVLNSKAAKNLPFHVSHYESRGLMKKISGQQLLNEIGCSKETLLNQFNEYNKFSDYASKTPQKTIDPFGKKFFPSTPFNLDDEFHVSIICRVVHFTMGGVKIDPGARVLTSNNINPSSKDKVEPILGLYAAGELAGNIHGYNRLGGSSLLACVCFGRVAANSATQYLLQNLSNNSLDTKQVAISRLNKIRLHLDPDQHDIIVSFEDDNATENTSPAPKKSKKPTDKKTASPKKTKKSKKTLKKPKAFSVPKKEYSMNEIAKHTKEDDCWIAVKGAVLDVSNFYDDHPGGKQSLVNFGGKDASEAFEMLHDDNVISKYAASTVIGRVKGQKLTLKA